MSVVLGVTIVYKYFLELCSLSKSFKVALFYKDSNFKSKKWNITEVFVPENNFLFYEVMEKNWFLKAFPADTSKNNYCFWLLKERKYLKSKIITLKNWQNSSVLAF